jgi:hypothetical protein
MKGQGNIRCRSHGVLLPLFKGIWRPIARNEIVKWRVGANIASVASDELGHQTRPLERISDERECGSAYDRSPFDRDNVAR